MSSSTRQRTGQPSWPPDPRLDRLFCVLFCPVLSAHTNKSRPCGISERTDRYQKVTLLIRMTSSHSARRCCTHDFQTPGSSTRTNPRAIRFQQATPCLPGILLCDAFSSFCNTIPALIRTNESATRMAGYSGWFCRSRLEDEMNFE